MGKNKNISERKRIRIATSELRNISVRGRYFNEKINNDPTHILSQLRKASPEHYDFLLKEFGKYQPLGVVEKAKPKDFLKNHLEFVDFNSEFIWAKNILIQNSAKIKSFLQLSIQYSNEVLHRRYDEALVSLNRIEKEFGLSLWLIQNKISFYQLSQGLEAQKKYSNEIKSQLTNGSLAKYLVHWISVRNESQTTIARFKNQILGSLNKLDSEKQKGYKEFLVHHLYDNEVDDPNNIIQVLRISYSSSLIDYYEAFISLLNVMVLEKNSFYRPKLILFLSQYSSLFSDSRLDNLKVIFYQKDLGNEIQEDASSLFNKLLKGDFSGVEAEISKMDFATKNSAATIFIYSFAQALSNNGRKTDEALNQTDSLYDIIISGLSKILMRGVIEASKEYNELNKIAVNFSAFRWSQAIKLIFLKEDSLFNIRCNGGLINVLKSGVTSPVFLDFINDEDLYIPLEKAFSCSIRHTHTGIYIETLKTGVIDPRINSLFPPFCHYIKSVVNFNNKNYNYAIKEAEKLTESGKGFFRRRGYGIITHSFLEMEKYKEASISTVDYYLKNKNSYPFLPLVQFSEILKPGSLIWDTNNSLIELSILLYSCYKHVNKNLEHPRRFAYEDFLINCGVKKPSQLKAILPSLEKEKLIFYLRFVCLESIMDTSSVFQSGSGEVTEERLEICRFLTEIDPSNEDIYKNEIQEIVRRQIITSRRQEIDQSRIYVDIKSIKDWAEYELEESFQRYLTYLDSNLRRSFNGVINSKTVVSNSAISIPENEVDELLKFMVTEIRKKYLSADIGLDRFISTRIRHGELERTMRIPIQRHELITKKEKKNGPYMPNSYWISRIDTTPENLVHIDKAFKFFSERYDNLISIIANEWLQIKSPEKPKGLFNFSFKEPEFFRIENSLDTDSTLSDFIDLVIKYLDNTLIYLLVQIREKLNSNGKQEAKKLLTDLNDSIFKVTTTPIISFELQRAISQARTDLTAQFDKIIEWFYPSSEGSSSPFTIEDALLVAEAIIKEGTPNFKITILENSSEEFSIHGQLPIFIDIFLNMFENVVKRSSLETPKAEIEINHEMINEDYFRITLNVTNDLGDSLDVNLLDSKLSRIKELLHNGSYSEYIAKERNSGLLKIFKSVNDFSVIGSDEKPEMDFGIYDSKFQISINVPFKMFVLEQEGN